MDKIVEISLSKIEHGKTRTNTGKTSLLHRHLLVNSLLNRVRCTDKNTPSKDTLMNYREPKSLVDMESEDWEIEKIPTLEESSRKQRSRRGDKDLSWRQTSSLVRVTECRDIEIESCQEHTDRSDNKSFSDCAKNITSEDIDSRITSFEKSGRKRHHVNDCDKLDQICSKKPCLSLNISPKSQEPFAITNLASLFSDMVANSDRESSKLSLKNNVFSAMVAC